jgi:hypothetical protein
MTTEAVAFYGLLIDDNDPGWKSLCDRHGWSYGIDVYPDQMLLAEFHADLLQDPKWKAEFERDLSIKYVLKKSIPMDDIFGGCTICSYGNLHSSKNLQKRYYVAIWGTEVMGRASGKRVKGRILEAGRQTEWDSWLEAFCRRLRIRFNQPGWWLVFWSC